jgi:outer membrane biosynthesis protein TonB
MIPRFLVPFNARPPAPSAAEPEARRLSTDMDSRTLVPSGMPVIELDARTTIPAYLPLDVLASRVVVPRDMPSKPLDVTSSIPSYVQMTILDSRVAIPKDVKPAKPGEARGPVNAALLPDVVDPDIFTTGDVNLLVKPVEERISAWQAVSRFSSIVFHTALIVFILFEPKLFPYRPPTQEELDMARRQLSFVTYLPPPLKDTPRDSIPPGSLKSPAIRINPQVLKQLAPPTPELQPNPGPAPKERVTRELPNPPVPNLPASPVPQPENRQESAPPLRAEAPKIAQAPGRGLILPNSSPGRTLQDSVRSAVREPGVGTGIASGGPIPGGMGGRGGGGQAFGALQMLTPTEGVDFSNYLARVLASVKRNWYAVIPESARMGEKGMVVLQFRIMRDGSVPYPQPDMVSSSSKEPLDRAAYSAIRSSTPFEQLPPAFSGPFIELRFIFLYNLPLDYAK